MHRIKLVFILATFLLFPLFAVSQSARPSWEAIEEALGRKGQLQADSVMKFGMPRADLNVTAAGVLLRPAFALGSWVAFDAPGANGRMMGDLVLTEDEVAPVMASLQDGGLQITALHNHLLHESPRVLYMHVYGHGDAAQLASAVKTALALTGTPAAAASAATVDLGLDVAAIEQALGYKGKVNSGVLQFSVPRSETIREHGTAVPNPMGIATALNFQSAANGKAAITGDFVLLAAEVNPVIRALGKAHIAVTALHSHMLHETPRLYFLHFWAVDDAVSLARGLRAALNQTASVKASP
ncbi:MAG TPA: DUF1259 domain-containing protein [Terriglobales bacterium]|nr:DUF1259 domain-containing protein [Terriglobales bacterium]